MTQDFWNFGDTAKLDQADADAVAELADALERTLGMARLLANQGRTVDLAGLDHQAGLLCAKALDLQPGYGRGLRPRLVGLCGEIDLLIAAIIPNPSPSTGKKPRQ
jgi:hypothetical protein